jgi:2-polyprenyl-3-methyl-5-hydroxy-6-metoxy-1,4-benzoquinol methylase
MGTIEENLKQWSSYNWPECGDEWSVVWGGSDYLWSGTIFPRILSFLPTESVLEIAPGYGRCTQYLHPFCNKLAVVDMTDKCIKACQDRFKAYSHIEYFINDGKSLDMINDESIDFVFSWDSLVHVESDVIFLYLKALSSILKPNGYGFIHHSNIGTFVDPKSKKLTIENPHWRATGMTAALFRKYCDECGLKCISQEIIPWGGDDLNDCFSLFTKDPTKSDLETVIIENPDFMREAVVMNKISKLYNRQPPEEKK